MIIDCEEARRTPKMKKWRIIDDPAQNGAWNMAVDTALLAEAENKKALPTLRFYSWSEPTLTTGYAQNYGGLNLEYLAQNKIAITRRPTGGRALLHDNEVTYSVVIPSTSSHYGSLRDIYFFVSSALKKALEEVGIPPDTNETETGSRRSGSCFATKTRHEITIDGRKITGSSQRRIKNAALQHGFISLSNDTERNLACIQWNSEEEREKAKLRMGGINDFADKKVSATNLKKAIRCSFEELYDITFFEEGLTEEERGMAGLLLQDSEADLMVNK